MEFNPIELLSAIVVVIGGLVFFIALIKGDKGGALVGVIIALIGLFGYLYLAKLPNIIKLPKIERNINYVNDANQKILASWNYDERNAQSDFNHSNLQSSPRGGGSSTLRLPRQSFGVTG